MLLPPVEPSQYTSIRFTETLAIEGLLPSIGSVGDAYDNAAAESVMGLFKNEAITTGSPFRAGPLKNADDVENVTMAWVHWYNEERLHSYLGYVPPVEFEAEYYARPEVPSSDGATNKEVA